MIKNLMGIGLGFKRRHTAGQHNHRHPVLPGVGDDIGGIGNARADGGKQHARRSVVMPGAFGHKAAGVFVFHQGDFQPGNVERIHHCQNFATRNAKSVATAGLIQPFGDDFRGGLTAGNCIGHLAQPLSSGGK